MKFDAELESLKADIQKSIGGRFLEEAKNQQHRIEQSKTDMAYFAKTFFGHYLTKPPSKLHLYLYERLSEMVLRSVKTREGDREADAAPRGNAKSTIVTLIFPLWCAAFQYRKFILIVSETENQGKDFLLSLKAELEGNPLLQQDFPDLCGQGPIWQAANIITANGVRIRCLGAGQKLRGMRHGADRPDLVICDDLENDESVLSPSQRDKLETWFFRALTKVGKPHTVYILVGTILHYDSLLSRLLSRPGWKGAKFRSVIRWSKSPLWEQWESIFSDTTQGKAEVETRADRFFNDNRESMLADTEVLWPEEEDYYYLMKMRLSDGPAHFDSEKQNEPLNPEECLFKPEWFQYWDDSNTDLTDIPLYCAVDPSMGKQSARSDPCAITLGRYHDGVIYLEAAHIEKRHPDRIIEDILTIHQKTPIHMVGVETVQFQEFFKDTLEKTAHLRGLTLNVKEIRQGRDKFLRIQSLQPWIKNGWIRFKIGMRTLLEQLERFPLADHDDGPDSLEMLKSMLEKSVVAYAGLERDQETHNTFPRRSRPFLRHAP